MNDWQRRKLLLRWLFNAAFGRIRVTQAQFRVAIFRLGTVNRRLGIR